jgi:LIM domain kinase 1
LCRHIADEEFPLRVVPGFGLELSSIVPRADKDAPEGFFDLMAQCVQQDPKRRPDWKYILHKLRSFELGLPRIENLGVYSREFLAA